MSDTETPGLKKGLENQKVLWPVMKRISPADDELALRLAAEAARELKGDLEERLQPAISALKTSPSHAAPQLGAFRLQLNGQDYVELSTREALDVYFALAQLLDEKALGAKEHTHIYAEDYSEEIVVWIDPTSQVVARIGP